MGHWRLLEPGTTRLKAHNRVKRERHAQPKRKYRVSKKKSTSGLTKGMFIYYPEVWYPK